MATLMHQKLINLQAVRAGPMWTIPQRRRAPTAGTCGAQGQSPTTRTVTVTAGRIGRSTGRTQEGRARPRNLLRQEKRCLQLMVGGITRTGRTLLTLFCTASKGRLCWMMEESFTCNWSIMVDLIDLLLLCFPFILLFSVLV